MPAIFLIYCLGAITACELFCLVPSESRRLNKEFQMGAIEAPALVTLVCMA